MSRRPVLSFVLATCLLALGCGEPGPDLRTEKESAEGRFLVRFVPETEPPPLHEIHRWTIELRRPDGAAVDGAWIRVDGGMPEHQHGLPTQPQVTRELGEGRYLVEGMKFSMGGWWVLDLAITAGAESDSVRFERVLEP